MMSTEIEIDPADFITIGTVGPKGQRVFYLQAGKGSQLVSLVIEKEQSWALSEAIRELVDDLDLKMDDSTEQTTYNEEAMDLREPIDPMFRVSQMGLGYDEERDSIVLIAQELVLNQGEEDDTLGLSNDALEPSVVRIWCSRAQMRALSRHAVGEVKAGRANPRQNGRLVYYWT